MKVHTLFRGIVLMFFSFTLVAGAKERAPSLRYNFVEGQTNVYHVQIETRGETGRDIMNGNIFVVAKSVSSNGFRLILRGNLMTRREPGSVPYYSGPMRMPMNISMQEGTEIQIDERGRVLRMGSDTPLPIPLGQLTRALFEVLPEKGSRWEIADDTFVLDDPQNTGPVEAYLPSRFGGMPYFGPNQGPALLAVTRRVNYEVTKSSDSTVNIRKQLHLESRMRTGTEPRAAASGEGILIFDTAQGLFRQIDLECKSSGNTENVVRKSSCKLHVRLLDGKELETALNPPPPPPTVTHKLTSEEFEKLLAELGSDDSFTRRSAITKLSGSKVENISAASFEAIAPLLSEPDSFMRQSAAKFISDNGSKESVPYLIKMLKESDFLIRQSAVKGLGRLRDVRAAAPLAEIIARGQSEVQEASAALTKIGSPAEDATLGLLKEKNIETRRRACVILGQIGTAKSIDPLKDALVDSEQSLTQAASEALRSIQIRL